MSDFSKLLVPDTPLWEIAVRGSVIYLVLFFLLRVLLKQGVGSLTDVTEVRMESQGQFSVIPRDGGRHGGG
ncbi:hypothetical protein ABZV78_27535 [Micromonospora sp. NPDC004540]|uniref:hypothetical protein n=1 Tax=Micromonospora sp. NPDC004540 TaxID=3154457 RepID=UPI0033ADFA15